jgi:sigma-B regulation protein RsbU (phosphoserine phosphatase)
MSFLRSNKNSAVYKRRVRFEENQTAGLLNVIVIFAFGAVAFTDWKIVADISLGYLYVLPIALSALVNPFPVTVVFAILCAILEELFGPATDINFRIHRIIIGLVGFLVVGFVVTRIARQRDRLALEVRHQRDEYERDLTLASQVQRQILPEPPIIPGLELAATMQTARLLGGDYYDFYKIDDDTVDAVIADVSGKGAAASLLMPSLAVALRLRARELSGPAAIIKDLDTVLKQITSTTMFVTVFYARLHPTRLILEYASGGHNPPILYRPKTGEFLSLEASGPIVGILPDTQFTNTTIQLSPGDILALYTDGVTEQENQDQEQFSIERLKTILAANQSQPAATIVSNIAEAVSNFAGDREQSDDLTAVVAKIL